MHRRLLITLFAVSVAATAQVRDTVNFSSTPAAAPMRGYSGGAPAAAQQHDAPVVTTTGPVDRFDFRVQERNLRVFNHGGTRGFVRGGNWGTSFRGRGCYRGFCGNVGYFQNPYLYAMPVYVESYNGPDFNNQPSAYQVYGGEIPKEYQAPGAAAVEAAYRQGQLEQKISSLADEVARLRAEKEARDRAGSEARTDRSFADANVAAGASDARGPSNAATATLVFKNGTKLDIANYAVVGRTLWVFDEQRARKILLADLDLDATQRANTANGFETRIPAK